LNQCWCNKKMKIGIDISPVLYGTGVSRYTENLVKNLLKLNSGDDYVLFGGSLRRRKGLVRFASTLSGIFVSKFFYYPPTLADIVWNRMHKFKVEKLIGKIDVFHSSDWTQPPTDAFKVTTIHDLIPLKFPKCIHPQIVSVHRRRLEWVKKEADRVVVPTEATKKDSVIYGIAEEKIRVISEAPGYSLSSRKDVDGVKRKYNIRTKYLLAVGLSPYKNTERIIKAFDLVGGGKDLKLVVVGRPNFVDIKERRGVMFVGSIPDTELSTLFTGAEALVFPSLYEGFGLPILDAFNCGIPVVTSNISSMPEVAGDAAVLVDPYDVNSIAEGIEKVLRGPKGFIEKGLARIKDFSWEKTAQETLKVYKESINK